MVSIIYVDNPIHRMAEEKENNLLSFLQLAWDCL